MNCKPGDIAIIVHPAMYGTLVEVLHAAPPGEFNLPDGQPAHSAHTDSWVFEFLGQPKRVATYGPLGTVFRNARFAACRDCWLRPIRDPGEDAVDESLTWAPVPEQQETAPA